MLVPRAASAPNEGGPPPLSLGRRNGGDKTDRAPGGERPGQAAAARLGDVAIASTSNAQWPMVVTIAAAVIQL